MQHCRTRIGDEHIAGAALRVEHFAEIEEGRIYLDFGNVRRPIEAGIHVVFMTAACPISGFIGELHGALIEGFAYVIEGACSGWEAGMIDS